MFRGEEVADVDYGRIDEILATPLGQTPMPEIPSIPTRIAPTSPTDSMDVYSLMDDWFLPKPELMKHVITVQLIACIMVALFLMVTSAQDLDSNGMIMSMVGFLVLVGSMLGIYGRI